MIAKNLALTRDYDGNVVVSVTLANKSQAEALQGLVGVELLDVTIKKHRKKRTLTQNAYLWAISDEIAKVINSTAKEVYRMGVKHVGVFEDLPIKEECVSRFLISWEHNGDGWIAEEKRESKLDGYKVIRCYYGSSVYNTKEMARLVDYIVEEAKELGIETMSVEEVERLVR